MKKLLIALLLLPSLAWGQEYARMNPYILGGGVAVSCTAAYGAEGATTGNCTDEGAAEQGDTDGWTNTTCDPFDHNGTAASGGGDYALNAVSNTAGDYFYRALTGTANNLYKLSFYARHNGTASAAGEWRCYLSTSSSTSNQYATKTLTDAVGDQVYAEYVKLFYLNARQDTLVCRERNGENDGGIYIDRFSIKPVTTTCLGSELLTTADASTTDANDISMWTEVGSGTLTAATSTPDPPAGQTYVTKFTTGANNDIFYIDLDGILTSGHEYMLSFQYIAVSGDAFKCGLSGATAATFIADTSESLEPATADTSWVQAGFSFTYDSASHRYFKCFENGTSDNATFAIDKLSIKEILSK